MFMKAGARAAELMTNVLPPRTGGVFACLDARPGLDVVLAAHAGLDKIVRGARHGNFYRWTVP